MNDNAKFCAECGAQLSDYTSGGIAIDDSVVQRSQMGAASVGNVNISPVISPTMTQTIPCCPNCENVLSDKNKLFKCQICGTKVCDTCGFSYHGLKLCETCKAQKKHEEEQEEERKIKDTIIGMKFTHIPAGDFMMGSDKYNHEQPVHKVMIKNPFYLGTYPVTQREWKAVMGNNPSRFEGDDNLPVEKVSWDDVQKFIKKLNASEETDKYRLPSEAEWEYACHAGTTTRYSFGDDESELSEYAWYEDNSGSKTHPVGQKKPNPWGLYDMHGNVWEWVQDTWHDNYNGAPTDGSAWEGSGSNRVDRGGSWYNRAGLCRSAYRFVNDQGIRGLYLGFRLVRSV
jgi:formylglycine-generating enzyme required for sulfatase activity